MYIPLGGNRKGKIRQILNMLVVWALTGLWHGASWNFVLWGVYNFVLLSIEKQVMPALEDLPDRLRNFLTMLAVLFTAGFTAVHMATKSAMVIPDRLA